jgi:hypothetical protein
MKPHQHQQKLLNLYYSVCIGDNVEQQGHHIKISNTTQHYLLFGKISQPKHKNAVAGENRHQCCPSRFGKFRPCSSQI